MQHVPIFNRESFSRYRINFISLSTSKSLDQLGIRLDFISSAVGHFRSPTMGFKSPIPPSNGESMTIEFPLGRPIDGDTVCILPELGASGAPQ